MDLNSIKDKVQRKGLNLWFKNNCKGTLEYATGVGKSRCGVLAADYVVSQNPEANILIITPTQAIRDEAWVDEFSKWGKSDILENNVEILYDSRFCDVIKENDAITAVITTMASQFMLHIITL